MYHNLIKHMNLDKLNTKTRICHIRKCKLAIRQL